MLSLKNENRYDFRKRMIKGHTENLRDFSLVAKEEEYEIKNGYSFIGDDISIVVKNAVDDFRSFMKNSMSVEEGDNGNIVLKLADDLGEYNVYKGYRIEVSDKIEISAHDERGLAQALYNLEDVISLKKAPYLKKDIYYRKPLYAPQMIHSGYGFDLYPDEYLLEVARSGRDTIMIFVKDINKTPHGFLDFNDVIERAAKFGIDVYAYSNIISKAHPLDAGAEEHYESTYGKLFDACPGFKGVILCGESVEFPSRDSHVSDKPWYNNFIDGIPTGKPSPGWFPCCDYPEWLKLIKR